MASNTGLPRSRPTSRSWCLILSDPKDAHVQSVLRHAAAYPSCEPVCVDTATALRDLRLVLRFDTGFKGWSGTVNDFDLQAIESIWYRRPQRPKAECIPINHEFAKLAESEMREVLQNLYRIAPCRILPNPCNNREADLKLRQLEVATSVGMRIPATTVSNDPSWIANIPDGTDHLCIKSLSAYHWWNDANSEYALKSACVNMEQLLSANHDVKLCPTLFQYYVPKRYEWRITIIDRTVFACRLSTQEVCGAKVDWRIVDCSRIPHEILPISPELERKLFAYLDELGLVFGAFDFIETPDGQFVFLECNPNGQWLWIELLTGAPISKAIAAYLFSSKTSNRGR